MEQQAKATARKSPGWTARLAILAIAMAILILFIAENFVLVEVRLIFVNVETRLAWGLLLSAFLGFVGGLVTPRLWR